MAFSMALALSGAGWFGLLSSVPVANAATAPYAPAKPTVARNGSGTITVTWVAPADGGDPITGYTATASPGGLFCTGGAAATSCDVTGLTNGSSYTFTVIATNTVGSSLASPASDAITPATVPNAPTGVIATAGQGQATVSWTTPSGNGGLPITGYTVTSTPASVGCTTSVTTCVVPSLLNGTGYVFHVVANNLVGPSAATDSSQVTPQATIPGKPTAVTASALDSAVRVTWTPPVDTGGSPITSYEVTSSPSNKMCSTTGTSCDVGSLVNGVTYTFTVVAYNAVGPSLTSDASNPATAGVTTGSTYHPVTPTRLLDTRFNVGIAGGLSSHHAQGFQVTSSGGPVPFGATGVTGNLTVTGQTAIGFLYIGPAPMDNPTSSTLNFPKGDDRANGVTVALSGDGKLYVTYAAPTLGPAAHAIFDVTGYFTLDTTGATYYPMTPTRILDSRIGNGLSGPFSSHVARTLNVPTGVVPASATAVTGNVTVTRQSSLGFIYVGPDAADNPTSSTLNFPFGDDRANGLTVQLGAGHTLSFTYAAPTLGPIADIIFDVTGYFIPGLGGAEYVPLDPARLLDSRFGTGLSGAFSSHVARTFQVTLHGGVPANAVAVTGNLTVTQQQTLGFLYCGPNAIDNPTSSTLNFPYGDDRANGMTVALGGGGTLSVTYAAPVLGPTAHVIFDVTGYFFIPTPT